LLITEKELMQHYLIEDVKVTAPMNRLSLDEAA
jgi:hypothetical protein